MMVQIFYIFVLALTLCTPPLFAQDKKPNPKNSDAMMGLYEVVLAEGTELGSVESRVKGKKRIVFRTLPFTEGVENFQIFLVLDTEKKNVIAETSVMEKTDKRATARVIKIADAYTIEDLVGKSVVRFDALRKSMGGSIIFRQNPNLQLGFIRQSFVLTSANIMTGASLNPIMFSSGVILESFLPKVSEAEWINWLGVRYQSNEYSPSMINLRRAKSDRTDAAKLQGKSTSTEIILQPWFDRFFIYHLAFLFGVKNKATESITIENSHSNGSVTMLMERENTSYGVEVATNPVPNIYSGVTLREAAAHQFTTQESSDLIDDIQTGEGEWGNNTVNIWGEMIEGISSQFKLRVRFSIIRSSDEVQNLNHVGSDAPQSLVDWGYSIEAGLLYVR